MKNNSIKKKILKNMKQFFFYIYTKLKLNKKCNLAAPVSTKLHPCLVSLTPMITQLTLQILTLNR